MAQQATVRVRGLRELNQAFNRGPKVLKRGFRQDMRQMAEPIRSMSASRALTEIRNMGRSEAWAGMRTGVTTRVVYVAPKSRNRGGRKRKNLAPLLLERAMIPALEANQPHVIRRFDRILATMGRDWERH